MLGLEYPESYRSRSLDDRGGTVSWTILLRLGSSRVDPSRFGRVKAVAEWVRAEKSEGRIDDLWPGEVEEDGILGGLKS